MANSIRRAKPVTRNRTSYKSLDSIAKSDKVSEVWSEESTGDGIWVQLAPGYSWEECHSIHEDTVGAVLVSFKSVVKCFCESCSE
jgi:hypothetical protein